MRKLILLSLLTIVWTVNAATPYKYLEFKTIENASFVVEVAGLEIAVNDGVLSLSNTSGQKMNIDASTLASMQFTDGSDAVNNIVIDSDTRVQVYNLDGTVVGTFANVSDAMHLLAPGVYVLKSTEGQTVKIMIGK